MPTARRTVFFCSSVKALKEFVSMVRERSRGTVSENVGGLLPDFTFRNSVHTQALTPSPHDSSLLGRSVAKWTTPSLHNETETF